MSTDLTWTIFAGMAILCCGFMHSAAAAEWLEDDEFPADCYLGAALAVLGAAGAAVVSGLGHPTMFLGALGHPGTGIFYELLGSIVAAAAVSVLLVLRHREAAENVRKICALCVVLGSLVLTAGIGITFTMEWRAAWNSCWIIPTFVSFGLLSASLLFSRVGPDSPAASLRLKAPAVLGFLTVFFTAFYVGSLFLSGNAEAVAAAQSALNGNHAVIFWLTLLMTAFSSITVFISAFRRYHLAAVLLAATAASGFQYLLLVMDMPAWSFFVR